MLVSFLSNLVLALKAFASTAVGAPTWGCSWSAQSNIDHGMTSLVNEPLT
jgi:hypothetical protein